MTPGEAVKYVNSFFVYKSDGTVDRWQFKSPGDCENYSLLVLKEIAGGQRTATNWLLTGKAYMWYAKTNSGAGHAILEYRGRFVDNRYKRWMTSLDDMDLQTSGRKRYSKLQIAAKLGFGWF
jgi:predicted transglutaminase-like cysteine proteinase